VHLAAVDPSLINGLEQSFEGRLPADGLTVEAAAKAWADAVYESLSEALVLARVFAVLPFGALTGRERHEAEKVAVQTEQALSEDAPVLVLMASRGARPAWNDRYASRGHVAIPLASRSFVHSAPMIASLLHELGVEPRSSWPPPLDDSSEGKMKTFYVFDASTTTDPSGRRTICDEGFVREHDVRTVFGVGNGHGTSPAFVMVLFARQHVTRAVADRFKPLAQVFAHATAGAFARGDVFAQQAERVSAAG
jgi:hypothetical protein